ncbi:MAG: tetratricopeptide repeat protein, partial [Opitutaceae bacterium]|nr:tetratricopeptide repeat protein [Opitutaceae bacterium]
VLAQIESPGAPPTDELHRAIQWRLLFPLVGRALHLPPVLFFGLAHLGAVLSLTWMIALLRRAGLPWAETALATIALGAASWFFTSTGWLGYFDSWLALALLVAAFAEHRWLVWLACLLAPWVDERFIAAAPLVLLCRWLHRPAEVTVRRDALVPAAILVAFLAVRLGLLAPRSGEGATVGSYLAVRDYLDAPLSRLALGVWEGLRAGWALVAIAVALLWRNRTHAFALAAAAVVLAALGLATAQDYSRSMTMLLPIALLGPLRAAGAPPAWWPTALRAVAGAALLLPAHHVMNDRVVPIFNLRHQLDLFENPPAAVMPELYELRALHQMSRGEFAAADTSLAFAIRLASNPASPAKQRGILAATQGRWSDARQHFALMAEHAPADPDAWLMCAQASLALNEPAKARTEMDRALGLAPADWKTRPDVARFLAKLDATRASR